MSLTSQTRPVLYGIALLLIEGCGARPLEYSDDSVTFDDGGVMDSSTPGTLDLSGESCGMLAVDESDWINSHRACSTDSDCTVGQTQCAALAGCNGAFINLSGIEGLVAIVAAGVAQSCVDAACLCSHDPLASPACNQGLCGAQAKRNSVGGSCNSDNDCDQLSCVHQDPFTGGYCSSVQLDCQHNPTCPAGSVCVDVSVADPSSGSATQSLCLKECGSPTDCRIPEGYTCCPDAPSSNGAGFCYPNGCP